jgi:hypothetical protein
MLESTFSQKNGWKCIFKPHKQENSFHKGETVVYEGNTCRVTRVKPLLVIKCGNRVVCGNLYKQIRPEQSFNH